MFLLDIANDSDELEEYLTKKRCDGIVRLNFSGELLMIQKKLIFVAIVGTILSHAGIAADYTYLTDEQAKSIVISLLPSDQQDLIEAVDTYPTLDSLPDSLKKDLKEVLHRVPKDIVSMVQKV